MHVLVSMTKEERAFRRVWAIVLFVLVVVFQYNFILNHFLVRGAYLLDSGWFAGLVYHNIPLSNPIAISQGSYFATHVSPILSVFSLLSTLQPLPLPFYFGLFQGVVYGTVAIGGLLHLQSLIGFRSTLERLGVICLSLLFGFNGISLASTGYPHFEPLYCGLALIFLAFLRQSRPKIAALTFLALVVVREDAGLHVFGFLFLLILASYRDKGLEPFRRTLIKFGIIAAIYPILAILIQKSFFPTDNAMARIYFGDPPYAHLDWHLFENRSRVLLTEKAYVWVPWVLCLFGALRWRSLRLSIGFFAVLPWIVFNVLAHSEIAGTLFTYYACPLIISLAWPAISYSFPKSKVSRSGTIVLQSAMLLSSVILFLGFVPQSTNLVRQGVTIQKSSPSDYNQVRNVVKEMLKRPTAYFDGAIASLYPHDVPASQLFPKSDDKEVSAIMGFHDSIYLSRGIELGVKSGLFNYYGHKSLPVYLLSNEDLDLDSNWGTLVFNDQSRITIWMLQCGPGSFRNLPDPSIVSPLNIQSEYVCFGPYVSLDPGDYDAVFEIEFASNSPQGSIRCDIVYAQGSKQLAQTSAPYSSGQKKVDVKLPFTLGKDVSGELIEFRVWKSDPVELTIRSVECLPRKDRARDYKKRD